jgi:ACS family glucarate transporter-like MFS transporter
MPAAGVVGEEQEDGGEELALLGGQTAAASSSADDGPPPSQQQWRSMRFRLALVAATGEAIAYGQRIAVPVALVRMQAELGWDKLTQGRVMVGFWVGYAVMQIPGGVLTTRFGPRLVIGCSLMLSMVLHMLMPTAANESPTAIIGLRCVQGLCQGTMIPGYAVCYL